MNVATNEANKIYTTNNEEKRETMKKIKTNTEKLIEIRIKKGLSISKLSNLTNITQTGLTNIEREKANPSPKTAKALAEALELEFDDLFEIV